MQRMTGDLISLALPRIEDALQGCDHTLVVLPT